MREIRAIGASTSCVVMTGFASVSAVVESMRLGASDFIEKPTLEEELIETVRRSLERSHVQVSEEATLPLSAIHRPLRQLPAACSAAERWATLIVKGCGGSRDLPTIDLWAREAGVSHTQPYRPDGRMPTGRHVTE